MDASQAALIALVVIAFAAGWFARGRRDAPEPSTRIDAAARELDEAIGSALTSFQAALSLWQSGGAPPALAERTVGAFELRRSALEQLAARRSVDASVAEPLGQAVAEAGRLADGLAEFRLGVPLDTERERNLLRAERRLAFTRAALLLSRDPAGHASGRQ